MRPTTRRISSPSSGFEQCCEPTQPHHPDCNVWDLCTRELLSEGHQQSPSPVVVKKEGGDPLWSSLMGPLLRLSGLNEDSSRMSHGPNRSLALAHCMSKSCGNGSRGTAGLRATFVNSPNVDLLPGASDAPSNACRAEDNSPICRLLVFCELHLFLSCVLQPRSLRLVSPTLPLNKSSISRSEH